MVYAKFHLNNAVSHNALHNETMLSERANSPGSVWDSLGRWGYPFATGAAPCRTVIVKATPCRWTHATWWSKLAQRRWTTLSRDCRSVSRQGTVAGALCRVNLERVEEFCDECEHVWFQVGWGIEEVVEGHVQAGQGEVLINKQQHQLEVV